MASSRGRSGAPEKRTHNQVAEELAKSNASSIVVDFNLIGTLLSLEGMDGDYV